jgi:hypothetical protein
MSDDIRQDDEVEAHGPHNLGAEERVDRTERMEGEDEPDVEAHGPIGSGPHNLGPHNQGPHNQGPHNQ